MVDILPFSPPSYSEKEIAQVTECLNRGWTGSGPKLKQFEEFFSRYKNVKHACGLSSCTSALFLSLKALGVTDGDEVITTGMTFCSTVNVILHCGARPILCDIDPCTKNISLDAVIRKITSKTKAIVPVHYAGYPCNMTDLMDIANRYDLYVVEDCAHAIEAMHNHRHCGSFGDIGCFSFYATKNIAIGEGGMALSDKESLISKICMLGLHGLSRDAWRRFSESQKRSYDVVEVGYKMNMTDMQAAIGLAQLERIDAMYTRRQEIWDTYTQELVNSSLELPVLPPDDSGDRHALHLYTVGLPDGVNRDELVWRCAKNYGVLLGVHYNAIPEFSVYQKLNIVADPAYELRNCLKWGEKTVSLSMSAAVSDNDCSRILDALTTTLKQLGG